MSEVEGGFGTVDQVAKFLSISRAKVYSLMDAGHLPYAKIGKSRRLPWAGVKALAARSMISP
jgi:excisionase family DNA binding protein